MLLGRDLVMQRLICATLHHCHVQSTSSNELAGVNVIEEDAESSSSSSSSSDEEELLDSVVRTV